MVLPLKNSSSAAAAWVGQIAKASAAPNTHFGLAMPIPSSSQFFRQILSVAPAKAGAHTPCPLSWLRSMGPCFAGTTSGPLPSLRQIKISDPVVGGRAVPEAAFGIEHELPQGVLGGPE